MRGGEKIFLPFAALAFSAVVLTSSGDFALGATFFLAASIFGTSCFVTFFCLKRRAFSKWASERRGKTLLTAVFDPWAPSKHFGKVYLGARVDTRLEMTDLVREIGRMWGGASMGHFKSFHVHSDVFVEEWKWSERGERKFDECVVAVEKGALEVVSRTFDLSEHGRLDLVTVEGLHVFLPPNELKVGLGKTPIVVLTEAGQFSARDRRSFYGASRKEAHGGRRDKSGRRGPHRDGL